MEVGGEKVAAGDHRDEWKGRGRGDAGRPFAEESPGHFRAGLPSPTTISYIVSLCALWGGNMVAMKVGLQGVPPLSAAGFRFLLASVSVLLFALVRRVRLTVDRGLWPHFLALGALFVAQHSVFFLGLNLTSASRSAVFLFTQPVFTVLLAHFLVPGERLTPARAGGILISLVGLLLVFGERLAGGSRTTLFGDTLVTASAVAWALQSVYMKRLVARVNPFVLTLSQMVVALPWFFLGNLLFEPRLVNRLDSRIVLAFLYQGCIIAGLTFVAWTALMRRHQIGQLSAFIFLTPIFGVFLSWLLLGEAITLPLFAGLVLVTAGIAVVNRPA
ncbi:MAG: DMT family transporter [candidate division NC10 bacterium]|nr:DMT family transporter [candidate division NC10 bacterium]